MAEFGREVPTAIWGMTDGFERFPTTITVYEKFLRLTARSGHDRRRRELWSVYVTNEDSGKDRDTYLLLLVSAAMDALGENAPRAHQVVLTVDDQRVGFVARGM